MEFSSGPGGISEAILLKVPLNPPFPKEEVIIENNYIYLRSDRFVKMKVSLDYQVFLYRKM
jgi:hypothetical protein